MMRQSKIMLFVLIGLVVIGYSIRMAGARTMSDKDFVKKASSGGMMEVTLGQMAARQGASDEVKNFGQRMVRDHNMANQQLSALAEKNHWDMSKDMDKNEHDMTKKLSGLTGRDFDRAYMQHMVQDHRNDVKMFEDMAKNGKDGDLKNFAQKQVPILQDHLKMAEDINNKIQKG